jgi:serine/threonine protein kinase
MQVRKAQASPSYSQGNTYTLLLEPSAEYDMRIYLQLFEIAQGGADSSFHEHSASDSTRKYIAQSFGCLANAVEFLHNLGFTQNNIRPENILMDKGRWFLSKFEQAANYKRGARGPIIESYEPGQSSSLLRSYLFCNENPLC